MKRFLVSGVGLLSTIFAFTPAFSADMSVKPRPSSAVQQPTVQASNWNGGQIGGNSGGSIGNNNFVEPGSVVCYLASCPETPFNFSGKPSSFVGGGFVGYRWQMGNAVIGVEGDATWQQVKSSLSQSTLSTIPGGLRTDSFDGSIKQEWEGSIRGRFGWLVTPMTLLYATGGVSFGQVSGSFSYDGSTATPTIVSGYGSWTDTLVGYTVGGGIESDISSLVGFPGVKARFEYRFTSYGSYSKDIPLSCSGTCTAITYPSSTAHIEVSDVYNQKFMAGLGFDF